MKTIHYFLTMCFLALLSTTYELHSQTTYVYSLSSDFQADESGAPDLIPIPNNDNLTGEFVTREVPESTCGQTGFAKGYFFEDDAGLQFNNPEGFIGQSYSIAFNFQIDEFIVPPQWVRILSFTHVDDVGIYIKLTNPPQNGTLEFWPYGTIGETDFFSPQDFYQLILVRNDSGLIKIYVNGSEFATYDDSESQKYVPQSPNNYIVWFRDHPSVAADEASPGFVSDIVISNYTWSAQDVADKWSDFCSDLLAVSERKESQCQIYPNPARDYITVTIPSTSITEIIVLDMFGKELLKQSVSDNRTQLNISSLNPGTYFVKVIATDKYILTKKFFKY